MTEHPKIDPFAAERTPALPVVVQHGLRDLALPGDLVDAAKAFTLAARAPRTRQAYRRAWAGFEAWCRKNGRQALPASPETVAGWMTALATGKGLPQALARSSINQALSAVIVAQRTAGHAFDRKHPLIASVWKGISNTKAKTEIVRKAQPLMDEELRKLLAKLRGDRPADVRDAALLALGWAAALRRSELVGLDWQRLGGDVAEGHDEQRGFVLVTDQGVSVKLMGSKASQDAAETIAIPRTDMPTACDALEAWAAFADLKPGEAVFRGIDQRQIIAAERLTDRSVSRILKGRVCKHFKNNGRGASEAEEIAALFSGHSMRAGYATSAAAKDMPSYRIRKHTRHKSPAVLEGYIRAAEQWTKGGLKGVGF
jgi:integrase